MFCLLASVGMSGVQTNKITGTVTEALDKAVGLEDPGVIKLIVGAVVAAAAGVIIIGGIKRIGRVASMLVPFMSLVFITLSLIAIGMHIQNVPGAFGMIFSKAFTFEAAGGGVLGYTCATVIRKGMARGVFSNEAGLGSSVIAHSASETKEPVKQGLWGIFEVFADTIIVCTMTALVILTSGVIDLDKGMTEYGDSTLVAEAFNTIFKVGNVEYGRYFVAIAILLFAFTTVLGWSHYGTKAIEYLAGKNAPVATKIYKIVFVLMIISGALMTSSIAWDISDTFNGMMMIPNLIGVLAMCPLVMKLTRNYVDRRIKGKDVEPMLSYDPEIQRENAKAIAETGED